MKFSTRTNWSLEESGLAQAHRECLASGQPLADLTASNPTRCGFDYPADWLNRLSDPAAFDYDPNPRGSLQARESVCRYYVDHNASVEAHQLFLTTSTSEAYSYLFKLLCDPGDEILVPQPSYPLFDFLADAEVVKLSTAALIYDHGWQLDLEGLRRQITLRTRAIVIVHPNNPAGHFTKPAEAEALATLCREHNLALIVDEVFLDYPIDSASNPQSFAAMHLDCLVFVVSGISKICALPQMKAAWLLALGPGSEQALTRLEILADTWLSMSAPVQNALPIWLAQREQLQSQIRHRVQTNLAQLDGALASQLSDHIAINRLQVEGGWYAILRIPSLQPDEITVKELLNRGAWVHPGYFFALPNSGWLVLSLLTQARVFSTGMAVLENYFARNQESY
jgi:aspartate/methionine/tyrosine aminotransferase